MGWVCNWSGSDMEWGWDGMGGMEYDMMQRDEMVCVVGGGGSMGWDGMGGL